MLSHLVDVFFYCRRNFPGDRDNALKVIKKAVSNSADSVPDILCLCGRIYKDKYVESEYKDQDSLREAIRWYVYI